MRLRRFIAAALLISALSPALAEEVKVYEKPLTIPTYRIGEAEYMTPWEARFGNIYPYPMLDKLTDDKYERTYRALWLENEYVKVLILPEIGGRLHGAQDKTNGYQFMFDQRTIKPALVGRAGAWICGGIEWNFPDGHRVSCFRPSDWRMVENPDGSKTVWTGEIERIYGMRWSVGNTVHPGRNWVETKVRLFNSTPYPHAFLYWADCGVRGTPEFQAVIPGEIATGHGKHQFFRWPINNGVDLRMWKNAPGGTSYFAWESESDYMGSYSPEEKGGMAHWADHFIVRGKKLWFCGTSPAGRLWEAVLTDNDAPLVEPQAGAYSDNQPDYHWIMPGETKVFSHFWFPVREIGIWDYANLEGVISLRLEKGEVKAGWSPTSRNKGAQVILTSEEKELFRRVIDSDPATPFLVSVKAPKGTDLYALKMFVLSSGGDTLAAFQHPRPASPPLPEAEPPFPAPEKVESIEKLYLTGDHLERFRDPGRAIEYYREALRRDPGDLRSNIALGIMTLKRGLYKEALEYFDRALKRDETSAAAWYYKGLASGGLGDSKEAEKSLNRASYDLGHYGAAHFELAQLTASEGRWTKALEHIERSIRGNGDNAQAWAVKSLILNCLGRYEEALTTALEIQKLDPLDFLSLVERAEALDGLDRKAEAAAFRDTLIQLTRLESENHLELAIRYARCGLYEKAAQVLRLITDRPGQKSVSPMVYYHLAYYSNLAGKKEEAADFRAKGEKASPGYCFPNRLESFPVLSWAVRENSGDARALYYLGTLYYSRERDTEAIECWEKAVAIEPGNAVAQRNLGYALARRKDLERARTAYEAAVKADPGSAVALLELEKVYHDLGMTAGERAAFLEKYRDTVFSSDPLLKSLIALYVQLGRYDDALACLTGHRFHSWEGGYEVHLYWVESRIRKGDIEFGAGNYEKALEHYRLSLDYPDNLESKAQPGALHIRQRYNVALALEALGRKKEARVVFEQMLTEKLRAGSAFLFFRGKALDKLGRKEEARAVFEQMLAVLKTGSEGEEDHHGEPELVPDKSRNPQALFHFKRYLALDGLGNIREAEQEQAKALALDPLVAIKAFCPPAAGW
jgi:tetratricopeptide (TPR) repeat protein